MADLLTEILARVLEGLANPAVVAVIALIIVILYIRSQEQFMVRQ